ncbi:MAG: MFS transporter [Patescibacteria group bacterium]
MSQKLLPVYILHFINYFNLMLWGPILDPIFREQKVTDQATKLILNGVLIAAYPFCQFFAIHPLNSLSEKIGRKKVLMYTQIGTLLSILLAIVALTLPILSRYSFGGISIGIWLLLISRFADGISGGNAMVTNNYANDIINSENLDKSKSFTSIEIAVIAGSLSGVFLGPIFQQSRFGVAGSLYLLLFICFIGVYLIWDRVKDLKLNSFTKISISKDLDLFHQIEKIKDYPKVQETLFYKFTFQFLFMSFITSIFLFLKNRLKISGSELSSVMFIVAIITLFTITVITPKIIQKFGLEKAFESSKYFLLGGLLLFFGFPFLKFTNAVGVALLIAYFVIVIGVTTALSLFKHFLTSTLSEDKQGHAIALEEQIVILAGFLGPITAGLIAALIQNLKLQSQTIFLYFFIVGLVYLGLNKVLFRRTKL